MSEDVLEYVPQRKLESGEWVPVEEFVVRIPAEEMAICYAAHVLRLEHVTEAEENLKNYVHSEPMKIQGKFQMVGFLSCTDTLRLPMLVSMSGDTGSSQAMGEMQKILPRQAEWRMSKDIGIQVLASVGWLGALTKARPPELTKDTSSTDYNPELLPNNLEIREEAAPSGYNKEQVALLKKTQQLAVGALEKCGSLHDKIADMGIVAIGQLLFKTQSRLFNALPDPDSEERERFETMRQQVVAARADD